MPNVFLSAKALSDFMYSILNDIERNGAAKGIGKPERLKHQDGYSRRINNEHRLIYDVKENIIAVKSCKGHYDDK